MAHLFSRLFKKREMSNCNHPPSALHDFSQYDTEYITYCIPFKNLINEAYCRDISVKIRSQLEIKRTVLE